MPVWWKSLAKRLECNGTEEETSSHFRFTNDDLKPVEPARRRWRSISFIDFWIADSFNVNTFMIAAASLEAGLNWWQAWLCVWIGYSICGCLVVLNGRAGAVYHIGFPIASRASFGIWGSMWPVLNRGVLACFWYGIQAWIGGQTVYILICSIWPSFGQRPILTRTIALGGPGQVTGLFLAFLLFWLFSLPFIWFPVHQIRHLFTVKAVVAPAGGISLLIWSSARAASIGPVFERASSVHGSDLAWVMISAIMATLNNFSTLIMNNSDLTRFAKTPSVALWPQLIAIPLSFGLTSFIGVFVGSSATILYPDNQSSVWNPLDVLSRFLVDDETGEPASSSTRAGVFFIAASFTVAQLGVNIAANTISAGMDFAALMPRYINVRRGGYICATVGIVICPWQFLTSATKFITYLSAYAVFLASILGVLVSDYYLVRNGGLDLPALYNPEKTGIYFGLMGFSWRGYAAYFSGISSNIVGVAGIAGAKIPKGAEYMFRFSFLNGFLISGAVYYLLSRIFTIPGGRTAGWHEYGDGEIHSSIVQDSETRQREQEEPSKPEGLSAGSFTMSEKRTDVNPPIQPMEAANSIRTISDSQV